MNIHLGRTQCNMLNPPNEGTIIDGSIHWKIGRDSQGKIVLRDAGICHPDFRNGMWLSDFVGWINSASMRQ